MVQLTEEHLYARNCKGPVCLISSSWKVTVLYLVDLFRDFFCAKDYKGHSLECKTNFTEPPNMCTCRAVKSG